MLIDDFTTGPYTSRPMYLFSGIDSNYQSISTNSDFPVRWTGFYVNMPSPHPSTLDVGSSGLSLGTGPDVFHRLTVIYGFNPDDSVGPLNQDLSTFTGFRVGFEANDSALNCNVVYYSRSGGIYASMGHNLTPSYTPFSVDFPFANFTGDATPDDVDIIVLILQSGSTIGANDYKITSFEAY